jgi:hypothetical protein
LNTLEPYAFHLCSALREVALSSALTKVDEGVFGETAIEQITLSTNITEVSKCAFMGCKSLATVAFGESITAIGAGAFGGCTSLSAVAFPKQLTDLGDDAFAGCSSLTSVVLPESLTSIGRSVFAGCGLETAELLEGITEISPYLFDCCESLQRLIIPVSVTKIDISSLNGCIPSMLIFYRGSEAQWGSIELVSEWEDQELLETTNPFYRSRIRYNYNR